MICCSSFFHFDDLILAFFFYISRYERRQLCHFYIKNVHICPFFKKTFYKYDFV